MTTKVKLALLAAVLASAVPQSHAFATLTLNQTGFAPLTIPDNGPGDLSPLPGSIIFVGPYGSYALEMNTGTTKPIVGSPFSPELSLVNTSVSAIPGAQPLTVTFQDDFFFPNTYQFNSIINGAAAADTVTFTTYADGVPLSTFTGGPGAFNSGNLGAVYGSGAPITLKIETVISQPNGGFTSFDADLSGTAVPDGGATAALLGVGVLGLAGFRRKK